MNETTIIIFRTVLIGGAGATLATAAGLPAAALIGGSVAVSLGARSGLRVAMDPRLRDLGFAGIGISLGAGIGPNVFQDLATWTTSLILLCASLAATLFAAAAILRAASGMTVRQRFWRQVRERCPTHWPRRRKAGDVITVLILQSLRLLILAAMLPLAVFFLVEPPSHLRPLAAMEPLEIVALLAAAFVLAAGLVRAGMPAAYLVAGMILSGLSHALGFTTGACPVGRSLFASRSPAARLARGSRGSR